MPRLNKVATSAYDIDQLVHKIVMNDCLSLSVKDQEMPIASTKARGETWYIWSPSSTYLILHYNIHRLLNFLRITQVFRTCIIRHSLLPLPPVALPHAYALENGRSTLGF